MTRLAVPALVILIALTRYFAGPGWSYALAAALWLAILAYCVSLDCRKTPPGGRP